MSVAEMKLKAINKIANLNDEAAINEILEHLEKFNINEQGGNHNLSQHYEAIKNQYGDVLKKLAE
jgi:hypothetical protein